MQEYTSPGEVAVPDGANLTGPLFEAARTSPDRVAVSHRVGDTFVDWTVRQFVDEVTAVAKGLIGLGVEPGERVCIMSATRLEWTVLDYAIWAAGAVTVPIYETSSAEQVEWIVSDSDAVGIVIETPELRSIFDEVSGKLPNCRNVFVIEEGGLDTLKAAGADVTDEQVQQRASAVTADDLATLVYTSGTTGRPKGCELTHRNFAWNVAQSESAISEVMRPSESTLLFLPLAHIFARYIQVATINAGVKLGYSTGIPQLLEELGMFKPTFLLAVPRVFEKVFNGAQQKAHGDGKGKIFDKAAAVAEQYSREQAAGAVGFGTKLQHGLFDKLVYGKLRAAMGGNVRYAVSGGAALGERLGHFFNGIGVTILEGYGLTETTAPASVNRPDAFKIGTVGKPLPGVSVKIAEDGEVLLKGGNIFVGYYQNEDATREVLEDDGWFHTGDIGQLDGEGYLRITGRKKEILVTAGGKNVAPAILEDRMRAHALVSQSMVVGDGKPFIAALITIDPEAFATWAEANGKAGKTVADLVDDPDLRAEVQKAVDEANQAVSKAESIRTFRILPEDFEVGVELSQKMSVKRHVVSEKYGHVIDDVYAGSKS
ncbi:long-chain fatty acid--CoA ligase [Egicoccus sp. AB-alg2]|uniref:AMP-dependent synthetase/ligase n=1 Tax=Egicoccus sp. AB-alg2 TaxID=3242693 RepID=UPI00359D78C3